MGSRRQRQLVLRLVMVVDGGGWWMGHGCPFGCLKINLLGNISKTTRHFFLIVSGSYRRVLKTFFGMFRFNTKISQLFFREQKKQPSWKYLQNFPIFFPTEEFGTNL